MLSARARNIQPSATLSINAKVKEMQKNGIDIVDLGIGEPDFNTPEHIKAAAKKAIDENFTRYTPAAGTEELKKAIRDKLHREGVDCEAVVVSPGAKYSLYLAMQALLDPGDEIIIPAPYWVSYAEQAALAGALPVIAETNSFQLDIAAMEEKLSEKTKVILINSPCNPTGAVFSLSALQELAELAVRKNLFIVSDEIYEKFVYGEKHFSMATLAPDRTITISGVSKTYAMTGWRIGYAAGPARLIKAMADIQSQSTSNPCSIAQKAAVAAINGPQDSVEKMVKEFDRRRQYVMKRLEELDMPFIEPKGAFYIFPETAAWGSSTEVAEAMLEKARVAVVPGAAFGSEDHVRISYATPMQTLEKAMERIGSWFNA